MRRGRIPQFSLWSLALGLSCLMAVPSGGQSTRPANPDEAIKTIRFRVMAMQQLVEEVAYLQDREKVVFSASRSRPTKWMTYRGIGPLRFYQSADLVNLEAMLEAPTPVAEFAPGKSGDWLLFFLSAPGAPQGSAYRVVGIPDQPDEVREGVRVYNLTGKPLAVNVNDQTLSLKPGAYDQMNPGPVNGRSMFMKIASQIGGKWELVSSTVYAHRPGARVTFYVLEDGDRFQFKQVTEPVRSAVSQN